MSRNVVWSDGQLRLISHKIFPIWAIQRIPMLRNVVWSHGQLRLISYKIFSIWTVQSVTISRNEIWSDGQFGLISYKILPIGAVEIFSISRNEVTRWTTEIDFKGEVLWLSPSSRVNRRTRSSFSISSRLHLRFRYLGFRRSRSCTELQLLSTLSRSVLVENPNRTICRSISVCIFIFRYVIGVL